ncbi:MAG: hypothetical protein E7296_07445 [Lachnospiraceae bacterium]|jgi:predicted ribosomally synthesized peptide with SipW-like signal peptide|nr:hypothetical protein [Lachnospiraceae bacterium]
MKEMKNIKKTALIVAAFIAVLGISVGGTYAWLSSRTTALENTFEVGSVETIVEEPDMELRGSVVYKKPSIKNVGKNDCYIRARVEISPADAGITLGSIGTGWKQDGDYYYYETPVAPDASTTNLFEQVILPNDWIVNGVATDSFKDFDVIVYQEAVQASLSLETGVETNYNNIWTAYGLK